MAMISLAKRRKQPGGVTKLSKLLKAGQDEEVWRVVIKGEAVTMADSDVWGKNQVISILKNQFAQVVEFVVCAQTFSLSAFNFVLVQKHRVLEIPLKSWPHCGKLATACSDV